MWRERGVSIKIEGKNDPRLVGVQQTADAVHPFRWMLRYTEIYAHKWDWRFFCRVIALFPLYSGLTCSPAYSNYLLPFGSNGKVHISQSNFSARPLPFQKPRRCKGKGRRRTHVHRLCTSLTNGQASRLSFCKVDLACVDDLPVVIILIPQQVLFDFLTSLQDSKEDLKMTTEEVMMTKAQKTESTKSLLRWAALFLGELRDGLTMV